MVLPCSLFLVVVLLAAPLLTGIHRHRLRATAGVLMTAAASHAGPAERGSGRSGDPLARHLAPARLPPAGRARRWPRPRIAAFGVWLAGLLYTLVYAYAGRATRESLLARGQSSAPPGHLAPMCNIPMDAYLTVAGLVLLVAAPWLTAGVVALDVRAARTLLGPSRAEELRAPGGAPRPRPGPGWSTPPTPSGAAWSGTCTTAPSSGWSRWR